MFFIILGFSSYILFFVLLPGIGAVVTRRRWSSFREKLYKYANLEELSYKSIKEAKKFIFKGKLESFKSDDIIWLKGASLSLCIDLNGQILYTLSNNNLIQTNWNNVLSMVEGTSFFVVGDLKYKDGVPFLEGDKKEPLLVVVHDKEYDIFQSLISKARDKNEMWNSYTPYSYITGVFILIILSYFAYKSSYNKTASFYLLVAAGTPFYFILPPGLILYLKYRKEWDKSIRYSILRDLSNLRNNRNRYEKFKWYSKLRERASLMFYMSGYLLNTMIAGTILYKMYQLLIYR